MNSLFATLTFSWTRDDKFEGCNKVLADAVEKLDTQCIEIRQTLFRFTKGKIEMVVEIYTSYEDWEKAIHDEDEAQEFLDNRLAAAGVDCKIAIDAEQTEFTPRSRDELKLHYEELRGQNYDK